jgi:hypothetical protein
MNDGHVDEFVYMEDTSKTGIDEWIQNHLQILKGELKYSNV